MLTVWRRASARLLTNSPRMKRTIIWIVSLCAVTSAAAQEISDTTWTGKGVAGLNLSQVSLSNWAAGGDGSVAFDVLLNYDLVYMGVIEKLKLLTDAEFTELEFPPD